MKYTKLKIDDKEFILIGEYEINSQKIYKFANGDEKIYCTKDNEDYTKIVDSKTLKDINKFFKTETDVVF